MWMTRRWLTTTRGVPPTMRAVGVDLPALPSSQLKLMREAISPGPVKPDEAIIKMEAAGVNFIDVYYRTGLYKPTRPLPYNRMVLGFEGSGTIVETNTSDSGFKVCALLALPFSFNAVRYRMEIELFSIPLNAQVLMRSIALRHCLEFS
jgi:NADPH:quinone reductase-like Zn-dependent oxidoreductase